jgi:hypothetical protein
VATNKGKSKEVAEDSAEVEAWEGELRSLRARMKVLGDLARVVEGKLRG